MLIGPQQKKELRPFVPQKIWKNNDHGAIRITFADRQWMVWSAWPVTTPGELCFRKLQRPLECVYVCGLFR